MGKSTVLAELLQKNQEEINWVRSHISITNGEKLAEANKLIQSVKEALLADDEQV